MRILFLMMMAILLGARAGAAEVVIVVSENATETEQLAAKIKKGMQ